MRHESKPTSWSHPLPTIPDTPSLTPLPSATSLPHLLSHRPWRKARHSCCRSWCGSTASPSHSGYAWTRGSVAPRKGEWVWFMGGACEDVVALGENISFVLFFNSWLKLRVDDLGGVGNFLICYVSTKLVYCCFVCL